ncbi:MAG: hypothetical protein IJL17_12645, partial [Kiritimatiellae bacterium]|nr:hypothetical protein [Kiritimatiellia bacterium]
GVQVRRRGTLQARGHALAPGHGRRNHDPKGDIALSAPDCGMITGTKSWTSFFMAASSATLTASAIKVFNLQIFSPHIEPEVSKRKMMFALYLSNDSMHISLLL